MSVDNLLKNVTATINFVLVFIISYDLLEVLSNRNLAILVVAVLILSYIGVVVAAGRVIQKTRTLSA
jgi:hypothetical protein